jgi:speckle-type POZ protein
MDASVFRAMLHFIYTDALPHIEEANRVPVAQGLLVAADTFNIDRLKLMSEEMLRKGINEETVASMLQLAEKYGCQGLKKACLMFIKSTPLHLLERGHAE